MLLTITISAGLFIGLPIVTFLAGWFACNTYQSKAAAIQKQLLQQANDELNKLKSQAVANAQALVKKL
jgi:H+/gluconate symporter-like permease